LTKPKKHQQKSHCYSQFTKKKIAQNSQTQRNALKSATAKFTIAPHDTQNWGKKFTFKIESKPQPKTRKTKQQHLVVMMLSQGERGRRNRRGVT